MTVRAKFYVYNIEEVKVGETQEKEGEYIYMQAVACASEVDPNHTWSKWTPSGSFQMYVTNPQVFGSFEKGKEYFIDITPAK